jgi:hypothetical protein
VSETLIANVLSLALFVISLVIALRVLFLCFQTGQTDHRLFILGLSLGIFSLTAMAHYADESMPNLLFNVKWFQYIGQDVCFLCIVLSQATSRSRDLHSLIRWEVVFFCLLLVLLTPLMPESFPYPIVTKIVLDGFCFLCCLLVFFFYLAALVRRETLFNVLVSAAFCLLSFGYILGILGYIDAQFAFLSIVGDGVRVCGFLFLLLAMVFKPAQVATSAER